MQEHAEYWQDQMAKGRVLAFGLVGDPAGAYGIAIVEVEDENAVLILTGGDPAIRSGRGFKYEVHPMPFGAVHPMTKDIPPSPLLG
jgi:hypothetical protein